MNNDKSIRGYYYNLFSSPYQYKSYKFPSAKKLEIYIKSLEKNLKKSYECLNFLNIHTYTNINFEILTQEIEQKLYENMKKNF